jgi:SAM-dependent methyltransferase
VTSTPISSAYPEHAFGGFTRCDTTVAFYGRLNALVKSTDTVLDVGCGRASYFETNTSSSYRIDMRNFKGKAQRVIGIDLDDAGEHNVSLDEFRLIKDIDNWPVEDASMDVVFSDFVMEHIDDPAAFFAQAARVLKPGGLLALRTPNRWSYVSIAASLIPNRLHGKVTGAVQEDRAEEDVFPVRYRCNTRGAIRRAMNRAGFDAAVWSIEGEPAYFAFSSMAYWLATFVHPILPSPMRTTLLAFGRKRPL